MYDRHYQLTVQCMHDKAPIQFNVVVAMVDN